MVDLNFFFFHTNNHPQTEHTHLSDEGHDVELFVNSLLDAVSFLMLFIVDTVAAPVFVAAEPPAATHHAFGAHETLGDNQILMKLFVII